MSLYRIASANAYDRTVQNINRRQTEIAQSQEQLSSGKRVLRASDDAVAATLAERARNRLARTEADLTALESSRSALVQAEAGLGEASELLHRVRELVVQAGDPVLAANNREDLAKQIEGLREQMLAVSNRQDANGFTLFGGLGGAVKPFVDLYGPQPGVRFDGQEGQYAATEYSLPHNLNGKAIWMRVPEGNGTLVTSLGGTNTGSVWADQTELSGATVSGNTYEVRFEQGTSGMQFRVFDLTTNTEVVPLTDYVDGKTVALEGGAISLEMKGVPKAGDTIEVRPSDNSDLFKTMQNIIDALRYKGANQQGELPHQISRGLKELDTGLDRILDARGRLGEWLNRADSMETLFSDKAVFYQNEQSIQEDLDMVKGISEFQSRQTALQAALQSYAQVQKLSLFQYIA